MDYPKLISEKWNLTAKFNCLQAIYFYAPSALAVPMCDSVVELHNSPSTAVELGNGKHTDSIKCCIVCTTQYRTVIRTCP